MGFDRTEWSIRNWSSSLAPCRVAEPAPRECEQTLLSHVETCFNVALRLTRNRISARSLTRELMEWAWHLDDDVIDSLRFKSVLLTQLRAIYTRSYARVNRSATTTTQRADNPESARYAIEVRGLCVHAEAEQLDEILELLDGLAGTAHVIDRATRSLVYEGTVNQVYEAITGNCGGR